MHACSLRGELSQLNWRLMGERGDETRMSRLKEQKELKIWSILSMSMEEEEEEMGDGMRR